MDVRWELYCWDHREAFNVGKYPALERLEAPVGQSLPDTLRLFRHAALMHAPSHREMPSVERRGQLVAAFIERHRRCDLGLANNADLRDDRFTDRTEDFTWFHYFEDRVLCDLEDAAFFEARPAYDTPPWNALRDRQYDALHAMRARPLPHKAPSK